MILGSVQFELFRIKQAEEHYGRALDQAVALQNRRIIGLIYHNMGLNYAKCGMPLLAEEHFRKALSIGVHEQSVLALTPFSSCLTSCTKTVLPKKRDVSAKRDLPDRPN